METHQKCRKKIYFVYEGTMEFSCSFHLRARRGKTLHQNILFPINLHTVFDCHKFILDRERFYA